jgi:hypothetical protein
MQKASAEWNDWVFAEVMRGVGFLASSSSFTSFV